MKKILVCLLLVLSLVSCKSMMLNMVGDTLGGADKNGIAPKKVDENNMMTVLTGEEDPILMGDFFPTALKLYDVMLAQNPEHQGLAVMTGSLYVMYANAFVQAEADLMDVVDYKLQASELQRAKLHYLRGRDYVFQAFDCRYEGFSDALLSGNDEKISEVLVQLEESDVMAAYWLGAGWLGAFSVDPLDTNQLKTLKGAVAILERAAELNPDYSDGAIWDALTQFYAAAPLDFGGDIDRAYFASSEALRVSGGRTPGPYITAAQSLNIPAQDKDAFIANLEAALAIDPDTNPAGRLQTIISQKKAQWLLDTIDDYFLDWGW